MYGTVPIRTNSRKEGRASAAAVYVILVGVCVFSNATQVATFVDSHFVMWVPGGKSTAQRSAAVASATKRLGARSLPFLGVVNSASVADKVFLERKLKRSTVGLHHCNPPPSPDQVRQYVGNPGSLYDCTAFH